MFFARFTKPTQNESKMEKSRKMNNLASGDNRPFIFLSDVLQEYGPCRVLLKSNQENMNGAEVEVEISFGEFLAREVENFAICIFDVHDLSLISGLELGEVLQFLKNLGKPGANSISLETGRDYCLDCQKTIQAVSLMNSTLLSSTVRKPKATSRSVKSTFIRMEVEPQKEQIVDEWAGEIEPLGLEFLQLKLVQGRMAAKREKEYGAHTGSGPAAQAAKRASMRGLSSGAISQTDNFFTRGNSVYFTGKFNRNGYPALWLDSSPNPSPPPKAKALSELRANLQNHLDEMFRREPEKSHTTLCDDLAKKLNESRGQGQRPFKGVTIRRITDDPGHRPKGGSKPKKLPVIK
jgi:hypothetical protein